MYVCMYVYIYIYNSIYIYNPIHRFVNSILLEHTSLSVYMCVCVYIYIYVCTQPINVVTMSSSPIKNLGNWPNILKYRVPREKTQTL